MAKRLGCLLEEFPAPKKVPCPENNFTVILSRAGQEKYGETLNFELGHTTSKGAHLVVVSKVCHWHPPAGSFSRTRIVVLEDGTFFFQVMLYSKTVGKFETVDSFLSMCDMMANVKGEYKFCPGIDPSEYESKYLSKIRYDVKNLRRMDHPFQRIDSCNCLLFHKLARNASIMEKDLDCVRCSACKRLVSVLNERLKTAASSPEKAKKQKPSSNCPLKYMSPQSQKKRKENSQRERAQDRARLQKYSHTELTLDDEQHDELSQLMDAIGEKGVSDVEALMQDADSYGVGESVREIWEMDKQRVKKCFKSDQKMNSTGKRSNRWSAVTIRLALAVYCRSPAAYGALKSFGLLQLPSRATLQAYTGAFLEDFGTNHDRMAKETERFSSFKQQHRGEGKKEPKGEGVLIFDEVKVISRLMWNSRSQKIVGLAMNPDDMSSLHDAYQLVNETSANEQTSYILQFLWRDLTSSFDVVGPYFSSGSELESKFILSCVLQTLRVFHLYGFHTCALVCDGASANVSALKSVCGTPGAYGVKSPSPDKHRVEPYFSNPFDPDKKIFCIICPSHQLKNMINALHSSRENGTKAFEHKGGTFGWIDIYKMWMRECERCQKGHARMVPRLRETHIIRDSWTKLNVSPAKIMQQEEVLSELYQYTHQASPPGDVFSAMLTLSYLEACNKLFEQGLLSHDRVMSSSHQVLLNIQEGYKFFTNWLDEIYETDGSFCATESSQKKFLSWQTWDNLRIDVYGFIELTKSFLESNPGYFLSPLRISGSAVETLFGQYKYMSGSKLDAVNYATCRSKYITKQAVHHSGQFYRDEKLNIPVAPLQKKKYNTKNK